MTNFILSYFFSLNRNLKVILQVISDLILIFSSLTIAMFLRLDYFSFLQNSDFWNCLTFLCVFNLFIYFKLNFYKNVIRFVSAKILNVIFISSILSGFFLLFYSQIFNLFIPRSVPFIFMLVIFLSTSVLRLFVRNLFLYNKYNQRINVGILGVNEKTIQFLNVINQDYQYEPICFFNSNEDYINSKIGGIYVKSISVLSKVIKEQNLKIIYINSDDIDFDIKHLLSKQLSKNPIIIKEIPNFENYISSSNILENSKSIKIETLLGREPVTPNKKLMEMNIKNKTVMITGAGGSIGNTLCKEIFKYRAKSIILVDNNEYALFKTYEYLKNQKLINKLKVKLVPLICSIQDIKKLNKIFTKFYIETIFHAAAYKHVPLVEMNVTEAIKNNIFGTQNLVDLSIKFKVKTFTLISSDKAVRPTSIMGVTKRFAELICQNASSINKSTIISIVRFGNVLASSGSVIPIFENQIKSGGPVTLTDKRIKRFFMTLNEAAELVIQSSSLSKRGNIFVLNMGKEINILDLAKQMIRLQGFNPCFKSKNHSNVIKNIEIIETGLRPGEKLFEELFIGDKPRVTQHPRILTIKEKSIPSKQLYKILEELNHYCKKNDVLKVYQIFKNAKIGFDTKDQTYDILQ